MSHALADPPRVVTRTEQAVDGVLDARDRRIGPYVGTDESLYLGIRDGTGRLQIGAGATPLPDLSLESGPGDVAQLAAHS